MDQKKVLIESHRDEEKNITQQTDPIRSNSPRFTVQDRMIQKFQSLKMARIESERLLKLADCPGPIIISSSQDNRKNQVPFINKQLNTPTMDVPKPASREALGNETVNADCISKQTNLRQAQLNAQLVDHFLAMTRHLGEAMNDPAGCQNHLRALTGQIVVMTTKLNEAMEGPEIERILKHVSPNGEISQKPVIVDPENGERAFIYSKTFPMQNILKITQHQLSQLKAMRCDKNASFTLEKKEENICTSQNVNLNSEIPQQPKYLQAQDSQLDAAQIMNHITALTKELNLFNKHVHQATHGKDTRTTDDLQNDISNNETDPQETTSTDNQSKLFEQTVASTGGTKLGVIKPIQLNEKQRESSVLVHLRAVQSQAEIKSQLLEIYRKKCKPSSPDLDKSAPSHVAESDAIPTLQMELEAMQDRAEHFRLALEKAENVSKKN